jgi:hypothetical protein
MTVAKANDSVLAISRLQVWFLSHGFMGCDFRAGKTVLCIMLLFDVSEMLQEER